MCYGFETIRDDPDSGGLTKVHPRDFFELFRMGKIKWSEDGYYFAGDTIGAWVRIGKEIVAVPMRWDLIYRDYRKKENLSIAELIKLKESQAWDPKQNRRVGFDSYNARSEGITETLSYRTPWAEGLRMVTPVRSFRERANMDGAPAEFRNREYQITLDEDYVFGGVWDRVTRQGESLDSCSIITGDSEGHRVRTQCWHERLPLILKWSQIEEWLDPGTTPERAFGMIRQFPGEAMVITDITRPKKPKNPEQTSLFD